MIKKIYALVGLFLLPIVFMQYSIAIAEDASLYQRLISHNETTRVAAIKKLKQNIDVMSFEEKQKLITALIETTSQVGTMDGSQPDNMGIAREALNEIGPPAIPFLIQYLKNNANHLPIQKDASGQYDWVPTRKYYSAYVLGQIGPDAKEAIPILLAELQSHHNSGAAYALGEIGKGAPEVINALQKVFDADFLELDLIIKSAKALRKLGVQPQKPTEAIISQLLTQLRGEDMIVEPPEAMINNQLEPAQALLLLGQHQEEAIELLKKAIDKNYDSSVYYVIEMLGPLAKETESKLIGKLKRGTSYPLPLIAALRSIGTPEALKSVKEYEEEIPQKMKEIRERLLSNEGVHPSSDGLDKDLQFLYAFGQAEEGIGKNLTDGFYYKTYTFQKCRLVMHFISHPDKKIEYRFEGLSK